MNNIFEEITKIGIIPAITINNAAKAGALATALKKGGISCAEVTFRTSETTAAIKNIASEVEGMMIGAGTVTATAQVDLAISSGAKFIVTPGFNKKVVKYCLEKEIPVIPGVLTPSEIEKAMELGLKMVKLFPAEQSGGVALIKALSGPYRGLLFVPSGGITESNINDYLALDCVAACVASFIADSKLVDSEKFDEIERICRNTVKKILEFKLIKN